jgi:hypothetical protein
MTEKQFKDHYVATFLASYMASRYDSDCMNGHPYNHQPVEDAVFLANKAWEQYYDPWDIGIETYRKGLGVSDLLLAVEAKDHDEAYEGYMHALSLDNKGIK